jgi:hypothetical protein
VDADADDVAGLDAFRDDLFKRLIDEDGVAGEFGCGGGEDKEPSGGDDRSSKRIVRGVYETYTHWGPTFPGASPEVSERVRRGRIQMSIADLSLSILAGDEASAGL